ncbi:MAG: hypothetical protein QXU48_03035 [Thermoplasmata archaeon]
MVDPVLLTYIEQELERDTPEETIKRINFSRFGTNIQILKKDGKKIFYSVREKTDFENARKIVEKLSL